MAFQKKTVGCSGCVIEAIERHNESWLRTLLSAANVEYSDTHWVARDSLHNFMGSLSRPDSFQLRFPVLLNPYSVPYREKCTHPIVEETLETGLPKNIVMSVVLAAMLHTTGKFNALQILVECHRFDIHESFVFHLRQSETDWGFMIIDPIAMSIS